MHAKKNEMVEKYVPAAVYRRTGLNSFAVQMLPGPGVVEIHCIEADWSCMLESLRSADDRRLGSVSDAQNALERRLCAIGTRGMFAKKGHEAARPIGFGEGVQVAVGPYEPGMKAFVHCRLRTVPSDGGQACRDAAGDAGPSEQEGRTGTCRESSPLPARKRRKVFKWSLN